MEENETKEAKATEKAGATEDTKRGDTPSQTTIVTEANAAAERLEVATKAMAEENTRREAIEARNILGGATEAGQGTVEKKEESPQDYAKRVLEGGLNKENLAKE